jgi:hypothetical protein
LADGKAQTMEESQRRVSAEANTADKLDSFNRLQPSCPRPICSGVTSASDSFAWLLDGTYGTNEQITAGKPVWSHEHYCSDDFVLTR